MSSNIPQNNAEGKSKADQWTEPRPRRDLFDPFEEDSKSKDPERSIDEILHHKGVFIRIESKFNTDDVPDFGPFHDDLENEQTYVKAIEVFVCGVSLDRLFLDKIRTYCPVLLYTESHGSSTMMRFIHPKFFR